MNIINRAVDEGIRQALLSKLLDVCDGTDDPDSRCPLKVCVCTDKDASADTIINAIIDTKIAATGIDWRPHDGR